MKSFKDIKTSTQLWLGFGVFLFIIFGISCISWQQTDKMAEQTKNLYEHPLAVRRALSDFGKNVLTMRIEFKNILLANSEEKWNEANTNYFLSKNDAQHQFDVLYDQFLGEKTDIDSLRIYFIRWSMLQEGNIKKSSKNELNIELLEHENDPLFSNARKNLFNKMQYIEDFARGKANQFYLESETLKGKLNMQFLFTVIASLVFLIIIARFLSKKISTPLYEIAEAAYLFSEGKLNTRSRYASKNEFGQLSEAFNEMADKIETEFTLNDKAASLAGVMLKEDDARKFCQILLNNLLQHTQSNMGSIYLLNDEKTLFEKFESIGMNAESCRSFSAANREGEFGIAIASGNISHIKNISAGTIYKFNTVTGAFIPKEIITIPITSGNEVLAIISLFSLHQYSALNVKFIENIFPTLTSRMIGILNYKTVIEFSHKLEQQNEKLERQKLEIEMMANEQSIQNRELEQQKYQLMEVSRLKTNFLSSMSHELRTPLNSVIALSGVLNRRLQQQIPEEEYSYLGVIERNGKHLLNLINDILDLSRIESGKVEMEKNRFTVQQLVNDVVSMVKPLADVKSVGLNVYTPIESVLLESDYNKCVHILQNIIGNAVKFTERGKVEVNIENTNDKVVISVRDSGIGMKPSDLPYIFDEFRQADGSNSRKYGGTGLGLSIAKKYTELLGGNIDVSSEVGKGSIFTFTLPLKAYYETKEPISVVPELLSGSAKKDASPVPSGKIILLVEDTEPMIVQMKDILEEEGYRIEVAKNGIEALDKIAQSVPDAVILDLMMPKMDGFEVLQKIREQKQTASLPVLILTAKILNNEELAVIKNNRAHQLIQKGKVSKESLIEAIGLLMVQKDDQPDIKKLKIKPGKVSGKPKILAIEDNADNMLALKALLENNCIFLEATDGYEAIEMAKNQLPDIILSDIAIPGKNGFQIFKEIRSTDTLKHIPVIVVTSSAMQSDKNYFLDYGFNGYVSKPINSKLLNDEINRWINKEN